MATTCGRPFVEYNTFRHGQPPLHIRKYDMGIRARGRAYEAVSNSWYYACKEADISIRYPGVYGSAEENLCVRFARSAETCPSRARAGRRARSLGSPSRCSVDAGSTTVRNSSSLVA